jgi:AcrR family transcriptional regulator
MTPAATSPVTSAPVKAARARNANASREALLDSGRKLFSERGFDNTTVRDIGEDAGVDPALIARYFGNKMNLYLATITAEDADSGRPENLDDPEAFISWLISRVDSRGPGPVLQALVRSDTSAEIREAARGHLTRRLVDPLAATLERRGVRNPQLRAEIAVSALIGVLLARSLGSFEQLGQLGRDELIALVSQVLPDLSS